MPGSSERFVNVRISPPYVATSEKIVLHRLFMEKKMKVYLI
jgi:hypothetical protein